MAAVTTVMLLLLRLLLVLGLFGSRVPRKIMDPCEQEPGGLRPWVTPCDVLSVY